MLLLAYSIITNIYLLINFSDNFEYFVVTELHRITRGYELYNDCASGMHKVSFRRSNYFAAYPTFVIEKKRNLFFRTKFP